MTKQTDYGCLCVAKWRDGERPRDVPAGHVALHDGDVTTYVYDTVGDFTAWRDWARSTFEGDHAAVAIVGSGDSYSVESMPVDVQDRLAELVEAEDHAGYSAAVQAWIASVEG